MALEQQIVQLFDRFLSRDAALLSTIKSFAGEFALIEDQWRFTLPALHQFVQATETEFSEIDYFAFRQLIFSSTINRSLSELGGKVSIARNHNNVDRSIYAVAKDPGRQQ